MSHYRIAVIPGDNIGPEVAAQGVRVLEHLETLGLCRFSLETFPWGARHYLEAGRAAPEDICDILKSFDAIYMGAHGDPLRVPDRMGSQQLMHPIRKGFDLFANVRPVKWHAGTEIPLKQTDPIDFVVVRENTEGEYAATGGRVHQGTPDEVAMQSSVVSRRGAERIMRYAFDLARRRGGKKHVHCVTKSNALAYTMVLWDEVFAQVSNINPSRRVPSMFEPIHGSAPDIAGQGIANPIAAILAVSMMLDWLGELEAARMIEASVAGLLAAGRVRTRDLGGRASTRKMTDAILQGLATRAPPEHVTRQQGRC